MLLNKAAAGSLAAADLGDLPAMLEMGQVALRPWRQHRSYRLSLFASAASTAQFKLCRAKGLSSEKAGIATSNNVPSSSTI
jgi:hypothetical protein